jgi:hypothetical protein
MDIRLNIYFIKLIKKLNTWNSKFKCGEDAYNVLFLKENGYECDIDLSFNNKYIFVYYNKNTNKLIVYFDGIDKDFIKYCDNVDLFNCKILLDEYTDRVKKTINIINYKYKNYKKLYLGYCLGGFMLNNYIHGNNIKAYTYNSWGIQITNNTKNNEIDITNYCEDIDYQSLFWKFNNNSKILNTHTFNKNFLDIFSNIKDIGLNKYFTKIHSIYYIDDKSIIIEF